MGHFVQDVVISLFGPKKQIEYSLLYDLQVASDTLLERLRQLRQT